MKKDYQMTRALFDTLLDTRSDEEKKMNPYAFVAKVVNEEFGIMGTVDKILIRG